MWHRLACVTPGHQDSLTPPPPPVSAVGGHVKGRIQRSEDLHLGWVNVSNSFHSAHFRNYRILYEGPEGRSPLGGVLSCASPRPNWILPCWRLGFSFYCFTSSDSLTDIFESLKNAKLLKHCGRWQVYRVKK